MNGAQANTASLAGMYCQRPVKRNSIMKVGNDISAHRTGRFAPSPSGDLHKGSLLAALAAFLQARAHGARWCMRIDDVDTPRVVAGKAGALLRTLETFGLYWDGPVLYQSRRDAAYTQAL